MDKLEKISFIIPFNDESELLKPLTKLMLEDGANSLKLMMRIGFVGLMPSHEYHMKIHVLPIHIRLSQGESVQTPNPLQELASVQLSTKGTILGSPYVDGQITVTLDDVNISAKGIYKIQCHMFDSADLNSSLHTNDSYFTVE